jgi:hypothetical protein
VAASVLQLARGPPTQDPAAEDPAGYRIPRTRIWREAVSTLRPEHPPAEPHQDLQVCLGCWSDLVYPVQWEESGPENWSVLLHCPNCETYRQGIFGQRTVDAFDEALNRGADALARDHGRLVRANMTEEIERFLSALDADAILPEDF